MNGSLAFLDYKKLLDFEYKGTKINETKNRI